MFFWVVLSIGVAWSRASAQLPDGYVRAFELAGEGRTEDALAGMEAVIRANPGFRPAYVGFARISYENRSNRARGFLEHVRDHGRRMPGAEFGLAYLAISQGDNERARVHLRKCLQLDPDAFECGWSFPLVASGQQVGTTLMSPRTRVLYRVQDAIINRRTATALQWLDEARAMNSEDPQFAAIVREQVFQARWFPYNNYQAALQAAEETLEGALKTGDPLMIIRSRSNVMNARMQVGPTAKTKEAMQLLIDDAAKWGFAESYITVVSQQAKVLAEEREFTDAIAVQKSVVDSYLKRGDSNSVAINTRELALLYRAAGNLAQARDLLEPYRNATAEKQFPWNLRALSQVYRELGNLVEALQLSSRTYSAFMERGFPWQAGAELSYLAAIYEDMGDRATAMRLARASYRSAKRFDDRGHQQAQLIRMGRLELLERRTEAALRLLMEADALSAKVLHVPYQTEAALWLGRAMLASGDGDRAEGHLRRALDLARKHGFFQMEVAALTAMGDLRGKEGDWIAGLEFHQQALGVARELRSPQLVAASEARVAEALMARGQEREAWPHLERGMQQLESMRSTVPTPYLRQQFLADHAGVWNLAIGLLLALHRANPEEGFDRKALEVAERGKARAFLDQLAASGDPAVPPVAASLRSERNALERNLRVALARLDRENTTAARNAAASAESALRTFDAENAVSRTAEARPVADIKRIQKYAATEEATLIQFAFGPTYGGAWVVSPEAVRWVDLAARAEVEAQAKRLLAAVTRRPNGDEDKAYVAPARALHRLLIERLTPKTGNATRWIVALDAPLDSIPLAALMDAKGRFLASRIALGYTPSFSALAEGARGGPGEARLDLAAWGDPLYVAASSKPGVTAQTTRSTYQRAGYRFDPLPNSRVEVQRIAGLFPASQRTVFVGRNATESSVKRLRLERYRRLHFATHAIADEQSPARSGIVLSMVSERGEDGVLRLHEIANLRLKADLVVLSACRTAVGRHVRGEGLMSLSRAFLTAGARSVLTTLWDVDDVTTPDFMVDFYRNLATRPAAEALRMAKRTMIRSSQSHPYYWAGFVINGNPASAEGPVAATSTPASSPTRPGEADALRPPR